MEQSPVPWHRPMPHPISPPNHHRIWSIKSCIRSCKTPYKECGLLNIATMSEGSAPIGTILWTV